MAGRSAASTWAIVIRLAAVLRDSRSASAISSGANPLHRVGTSERVGGESSAGRRRANSASRPACRAEAQDATRSNPTIVSINSASDNRAGIDRAVVELQRQPPRRAHADAGGCGSGGLGPGHLVQPGRIEPVLLAESARAGASGLDR